MVLHKKSVRSQNIMKFYLSLWTQVQSLQFLNKSKLKKGESGAEKAVQTRPNPEGLRFTSSNTSGASEIYLSDCY